jgi:exopolyphosphatase/guanosine-5'-triphosphate,3'-diphosphate pyrophosphatase
LGWGELTGVTKMYAFGTSAFRNAVNGQDIAEQIKSLTGITVDIIQGDKEAEYIYYGVKSALHMEKERSLIIDIGGGSIEFIIGDNDTIFWKKSLEIGAQTFSYARSDSS